MRRAEKVAAVALAVGILVASGTAGASTGTRPATVSVDLALSLKGYVVVNSTGLLATNEGQTSGSVMCPVGAVVYGGGVEIGSSSLGTSVNGSYPDGNRTWVGVVNNTTNVQWPFNVYATCAHKPKGYRQVESGPADNPAGTESGAVAICPSGMKVLGGGGASSASTSVGLGMSYPYHSKQFKYLSWAVAVGNTGTSDDTFYAWAICGKVAGYKIKIGSKVDNPSGEQSRAYVECPSGTFVLGGGLKANLALPAMRIQTTYPEASIIWNTFENNGTIYDGTITPYVTCAS